MPEVPALIKEAADARAAQQNPGEVEEEGPKEPVQVHTAFMLIQTLDGQTVLTPDIDTLVVPSRPVTRDEAYGMLATAIKDMEVQETSETTATRSAALTVQRSIEYNMRVREVTERQAVQQALEEAGGTLPPGLNGRG